MGAKDEAEHEQIPPDELDRITTAHYATIKSAFSKLSSSSLEDRRLAAVRLRTLSQRDVGISYSVSKEQVAVLLKQIESEKNLSAQVSEVSALSSVSHHASEVSDKQAIAQLLKKLKSPPFSQEVMFEAKYQEHLSQKSDEPKDFTVFEKMGLKKQDYVKEDALFGHTVYDFTRLDRDSLIEKSAVIEAALKKILLPKTDVVVLLEALQIAAFLEDRAPTILPEVAKLAEHGFWRVRSQSFEILFRTKQLNLLNAETKKKLTSDSIAELKEKVLEFGMK